MKVSCVVNGKARAVDGVWAARSAADCGRSVYLDVTLVCACLVQAGQANGRSVVTVEGLDGGTVQQAFVEAGAVQCGFCTPGLVVAAHDLLERMPHPTDAQIREALAGNICRCTGYAKILDAVHRAAGSG